MENMIFANDNMIASETLQTNLISWVSAYGILNDVELQAYFIPPSELRSKKSGNIHIPTVASRNAPYKSLSLPERATAFMKEQNINFRKKLLASRGKFVTTQIKLFIIASFLPRLINNICDVHVQNTSTRQHNDP